MCRMLFAALSTHNMQACEWRLRRSGPGVGQCAIHVSSEYARDNAGKAEGGHAGFVQSNMQDTAQRLRTALRIRS